MSDVALECLLKALKGLLETGKHSDLVVTCQGETFNVHKSIVCSQSEFFAKALSFEAGMEAKDGQVDLPVDDPTIVELLIQYFYEADYDPVCPPSETLKTGATPQSAPHSCSKVDGKLCQNKKIYRFICSHHSCGDDCTFNCADFICSKCHQAPEGNAEQLLMHTKLYEIADKYGVTGLKLLSAEKFRRACWKFWNDTNFPIAAHHACSTTPDNDFGVRSTVEKTISLHPELLGKPEIEDILSTFSGLAFRILKEEKKIE